MVTTTWAIKQIEINSNDQFSDVEAIRDATDEAAQVSNDFGRGNAKRVSDVGAAQ